MGLEAKKEKKNPKPASEGKEKKGKRDKIKK